MNEFRKFATKHVGINPITVDKVIGYENSKIKGYQTPMILEERELRVTQMSVFDRLMMDRIIWISGAIESNMASIIQAQLMFLDSLGKKDIKMHLDTPGGSVPAGLAIRDIMNYISSDVATVNLGMCASMGSILLSSGTKGKRSSLMFSKVMTHQVSHGTQGNVQDTRIDQYQAEQYNFVLFKILAQNTGKPFEDIFNLSRTNKWFNSDEAKKYGLIDEIIGNQKMSSMLDGFDDYYDKEVLKRGKLIK
jgi:ATP-dependent Clp protease protease subunit